MSSAGSQFVLLLWKNFKLQGRKKCVTVFEIIVPLFFALLLLMIRAISDSEYIDQTTTWPKYYISENGSVPFGRSKLFFTPNNTYTLALMNTIKADTNISTIQGFDTESDLIYDYYTNENSDLWAGIVFNGDFSSGIPTEVDYKLRVMLRKGSEDDDRWRTDRTYMFFATFGPRDTSNEPDGGVEPHYFDTGFLYLQYHINKAIIDSKASSAVVGSSVTVGMQKMPYPAYLSDVLTTVLQTNLPLFLVLSFILNALQMAKNIAYEKEKKLKEAMKMMGLSTAMYWISWFIKNLIYLTFVILIYTIIFSIKLGDKGKILNYTHPTMFFVFLLLYIIATIAFCFMISTFFSKANTAAFAAGILFFLTYFPVFFLNDRYETMSQGEKMAACLLHNIGMAFGCNAMLIYEGTGEGAQWTNFFEPGTVDDNFSLLDAMIMLIVDTILYMVIAWYVDNINPGDAGVAQPPWFPFMASYWCGNKPSYWCGGRVSDESAVSGEVNGDVPNNRFFERDPHDVKVGINISHLRKSFKSKVAVRDTSLHMFEGQITALLGHNGAGKTTTISMLTGFLKPTSGTASINGYDIRTDITNVRKTLGLCPQHNILFDLLTVEEHLEFFAILKGCERNRVKKEVENMIEILELQHKKRALSSTLSGGQKRKLSVGIALIGGSKTVILDEPTSGMDPAARRQTWDILQKCRKDRTIILTTHFMDEADILGDRIAIMADGVVKCCGTSMFLKKCYGAGYHMVLVKTKSCNIENLTLVIQGHIPTAIKESEISAEISYLLPFSESAKFQNLFKDIESRMSELGIQSFGTSATTMEEVFLKVGEGTGEDEEDKINGVVNTAYSSFDNLPKKAFEPGSEKNGSLPTPFYNSVSDQPSPKAPLDLPPIRGSPEYSMASQTETHKGQQQTSVVMENLTGNNVLDFNEGIKKNTGISHSLQQFYGMLVKKFIHARRNKAVLAAQLILPVVFTIMALAVEKSIPSVGDEPKYALDLSHYNDHVTSYSDGVTSTATSTNYANQYISTLGNTEKVDRSTFATFEAYFENKQSDIGISTFNKRYICAGDFEDSGSVLDITAHYNGQPYHGIATSLALAMNGVVKGAVGPTHSISTSNHPFPKKTSDNARRLFFSTNGTGFTIAISVLFGMAFMSASFGIFLIKERGTGAKHLQVVSGVGPLAFWVSTFIWDMINYIIPVFCILIVFAAFQTSAYVDENRLGIVFLIFLFYGWSVLPSVYLMHFAFKVPATGMVAISMVNLVSGLVCLLATYTLSIPILGTEDIGKALEWLFMIIFPNYDLGLALMDMYTNSGYQDVCETPEVQNACNLGVAGPCCFPDNCGKFSCFVYFNNFLNWEKPGIGREIFFMALQGFMYFFIVLMAEAGFLQSLYSCMCPKRADMSVIAHSNTNLQVDKDVAEEADRINKQTISNLQTTDSLILKNVNKVYGSGFHAVKGVSVGIPERECFGLLGQNGAGKTSTFKMLTGDEPLSSGSAYLKNFSVKGDIKEVQKNLGYCPQFDALIDQMTGRETLWMYARLRGIQENQIRDVVNRVIDTMMLRKHADKQCGFYSGGNKRKLSTAIALIGDPPFIFLDEPTTGMDPGARRQLWNILSAVRASGRTLILTSHSMEECDALCTRLVIMVNGRFVCYGSPQHLKNTFGHGYTLFCRMGLNKEGKVAGCENLVNFIKSKYQQAEIFDDNQGYVHFRIPDDNAKLADIFALMETAKQEYDVEDYSVHQTTLEQIFLTFTQNQVPPVEEKKKGCCKRCCFCLM